MGQSSKPPLTLDEAWSAGFDEGRREGLLEGFDEGYAAARESLSLLESFSLTYLGRWLLSKLKRR